MTQKELEARVQHLEDVEAIKKLQIAYSHYLEHWEEEQLIGLFSSSPDVSISAGTGIDVYKGPEGVRKFYHFANHYPTLQTETPPPGFLHRLISISGIVDVDPDGKTAKGRWFAIGFHAGHTAGEANAKLGSGTFENEYVKEDGKWKIIKIFHNALFYTPYPGGWQHLADTPEPPGPPTFARYPSGKIFPYHYKNPVTGK
jgi:hypothetical protein